MVKAKMIRQSVCQSSVKQGKAHKNVDELKNHLAITKIHVHKYESGSRSRLKLIYGFAIEVQLRSKRRAGQDIKGFGSIQNQLQR